MSDHDSCQSAPTSSGSVLVDEGNHDTMMHSVDAQSSVAPTAAGESLPRSYGWWSYVRGAAAVLVAIGVVALVAGKVFYDDWHAREIGDQHTVGLPENYAGASGWIPKLAARSGTAPLVLNYHNITPERTSKPYDVHAVEFRGQMKMLSAAGYTAMSGAEYVDYLRGKFEPKPNSFLLTFDDGASGTYRYADPILEEFGFRAMVMVISQSVGQNAPYYLTWAQIRKMEKSTRWSFGAHSAASHRRLTAINGNSASAFANRDAGGDSVESLDAYRTRIDDDLRKLEEDFSREKVRLVPLFAWPFSENAVGDESRRTSSADDLQAARIALEKVGASFVASFTNVEAPGPKSFVAYESTPIERLEIRVSHNLTDFARRVLATQALPVDQTYSLPQNHPYWTRYYVSADSPVRSESPDVVQVPEGETTYQADWAAAGTQHWAGYTARFTMGGNLSPGDSKASVNIDQVEDTRYFVAGTADEVYIAARRDGRTTRLIEYSISEPTEIQVVVTGGTVTISVGDRQQVVRDRLKPDSPVGPLGVVLNGGGSYDPKIQQLSVTGLG